MNYFRGFIAFLLTKEEQVCLSELQKQIQAQVREGVFVKPENFHVTLRFLGNVPKSSLPSLTTLLRETAALYSPFTTHLTDLGRFEAGKRSLIWLAMAENKHLMKLVQRLEHDLHKSGYTSDTRLYRPHITLIREAKLYGQFEKWSSVIKPRRKEINHTQLSLLESSTDRDGAVLYRELFSSPFSPS